MSSKLAVLTGPDRIRGLLLKHTLAGKCASWLVGSVPLVTARKMGLPSFHWKQFFKGENKQKQSPGREWMSTRRVCVSLSQELASPSPRTPSKLALLPDSAPRPEAGGGRFLASEAHRLATKIYLATGCSPALSDWQRAITGWMAAEAITGMDGSCKAEGWEPAQDLSYSSSFDLHRLNGDVQGPSWDYSGMVRDFLAPGLD